MDYNHTPKQWMNKYMQTTKWWLSRLFVDDGVVVTIRQEASNIFRFQPV